MTKHRKNRGLRIARLLMVLSSLSPLFVIWSIRGSDLIPDSYLFGICAVLVLIPNAFLWVRIQTAKQLNEKRELIVGLADDHRDHLLVYLFAMLLPFYAADLGGWRELTAVIVALGLIVFLFLHLNLHYMNLLFAAFDFRVFTIYPGASSNSLSGNEPWVLISRRVTLPEGESVVAYRLSDTVYLEVEE